MHVLDVALESDEKTARLVLSGEDCGDGGGLRMPGVVSTLRRMCTDDGVFLLVKQRARILVERLFLWSEKLSLGPDLRDDLRAVLAPLAGDWSKLLDAEKAATPSFAAAAAANLARTTADERRDDATDSAAASTSAAADEAPLKPKPDERGDTRRLEEAADSMNYDMLDDCKLIVDRDFSSDIDRLLTVPRKVTSKPCSWLGR